MKASSWLVLALFAATGAQAQEPLSFCQRMAARLPMKEKRVDGAVRAFDMQTMTTAQRWLTGGSTYFSFKLEPVEESEEEEKRIDSMCVSVPCTMEGPLRMTLGLKDGSTHVFEAQPGERARIEFVGTRIRCSDL